jgi:hypothetical protein
MGFEKLINFLSRNLSYNTIEELVLENSVKKVFANHIIFDINFVVYYCIVELEEEINDIIKIFYSLEFNYDISIEKRMIEYFNKKYWSKINDINQIIDGDNVNEIIIKFKNYLNIKSVDGISNIDNILFSKIFYKLDDWIKNFHNLDYVKDIIIFFDGIPSYAKILEQRRRRCKNYFETEIRRELFKDNFDDMKNDIIFDNDLHYNYFDWLNNKFSLNKSLGPSSNLILNLGVFLERRFNELYYEKIDIHISSGLENGEADNKIFKYIHEKNLVDDIVIHTCDSDLIHQILSQQVYFNLIQKNVSLSVIRYYTREFGGAQLIDSKKVIKFILKKYNDLNKYNNNNKINYKIILDILTLIYFFGNDNLPSSLEIACEINLEIMLQTHINVFKNNGNIIKIKNNIIKLDIDNLKKWLIEIKKNKTESIVILNKYFKLPYQLVSFLVKKLDCDIYNVIEKFFIPYYIYEGYRIIEVEKKKLFHEDIRYINYMKFRRKNLDKIPVNPLNLSSIPENLKKKYLDYKILIDKFIDFFDIENNGMPINNRIQLLDENSYQDLYKYISNKSVSISNKKYANYYKPYPYLINTENINNYPENLSDELVESYLKNLYYLVNINFNNMSEYSPCNFIHYNYNKVPDLNGIIKFINSNNSFNLYNKWDNEIINLKVKPEDYFDNLSHHLFITPYLKDSEYFSKINHIENIKSLIDMMYHEDNLFWYNINNDKDFNYRDIDSIKYLKLWKNNLKSLKIDNENKIELFNNDDKCI